MRGVEYLGRQRLCDLVQEAIAERDALQRDLDHWKSTAEQWRLAYIESRDDLRTRLEASEGELPAVTIYKEGLKERCTELEAQVAGLKAACTYLKLEAKR